MLRCTLELIPFGEESKKKTIGEIKIVNDGTGDIKTGNYIITLTVYKHETKDVLLRDSIDIKNYPRSLGSWALLQKSLSMFAERGSIE